MKKFLIAAVIALSFIGAAFAKTTYQIDLADSNNGTVVKITKDPYASDYKSIPPVDVTSYFQGNMPQPGDEIEVYYNFTCDNDIDWMTVCIIDDSEAAKWWTEISNQYLGIQGIKKGQPVKGMLSFKVSKKPVQNITVKLIYSNTVDSTVVLSRSGVKTGKK